MAETRIAKHELPESVKRLEAPLAVWDYVFALQDRARELAVVLERIAANAEDWHGPPPDDGHVRALAVIASWARAALGEERE